MSSSTTGAVGALLREDPVNRFAYDEHVPAAQAVSLLMPVERKKPYLAERPTVLHPVFDMSLPEGPLPGCDRQHVCQGVADLRRPRLA